MPTAKVLGIQTQFPTMSANLSPIAGFFALVTTSPTLTMTYILSALSVVILLLFIIAIVVKMRVQYVEVIAGGLFLLLVIIGLLFFNIKSAAKVQISSEQAGYTLSLSC